MMVKIMEPAKLTGPTDAIGAFVKGGTLTVIDGRGNVWIWDSSVTTDPEGDEIPAPSSFDEVAIGPGSRILVVSGTTMWVYDMNTGAWTEGLDITEKLPGEEEKIYEPWKKGHNASSRKLPDEEPTHGVHGGPKRKAAAKEKEHA